MALLFPAPSPASINLVDASAAAGDYDSDALAQPFLVSSPGQRPLQQRRSPCRPEPASAAAMQSDGVPLLGPLGEEQRLRLTLGLSRLNTEGSHLSPPPLTVARNSAAAPAAAAEGNAEHSSSMKPVPIPSVASSSLHPSAATSAGGLVTSSSTHPAAGIAPAIIAAPLPRGQQQSSSTQLQPLLLTELSDRVSQLERRMKVMEAQLRVANARAAEAAAKAERVEAEAAVAGLGYDIM